MLRYRADIKSIIYMVITTALLLIQWNLTSFSLVLWSWSMLMAVFVTVMTHNHNHLRMWRSKLLNELTDLWLTLFYGFPVFAWIPTHNQNHHKFTNKAQDDSRTYRVSEANNLLTLLTYPTISGFNQLPTNRAYLARCWREQPDRFWAAMRQIAALVIFTAGALILDWKKGLLYVVIPQQFALFSVLIFNYLQHVHADEESEFNHSRNITGPLFNFFMFNNGFHTAHHNQPGLHWSLLPKAHAALAKHIDPSLNEPSFLWLLFRSYVLSIFLPRFRTRSMRLERIAKTAPSGANTPSAA